VKYKNLCVEKIERDQFLIGAAELIDNNNQQQWLLLNPCSHSVKKHIKIIIIIKQ